MTTHHLTTTLPADAILIVTVVTILVLALLFVFSWLTRKRYGSTPVVMSGVGAVFILVVGIGLGPDLNWRTLSSQDTAAAEHRTSERWRVDAPVLQDWAEDQGLILYPPPRPGLFQIPEKSVHQAPWIRLNQNTIGQERSMEALHPDGTLETCTLRVVNVGWRGAQIETDCPEVNLEPLEIQNGDLSSTGWIQDSPEHEGSFTAQSPQGELLQCRLVTPWPLEKGQADHLVCEDRIVTAP